MASKLSAVKEVLGLPASDALLLDDHDEHFFTSCYSTFGMSATHTCLFS